MMDFFLHSARRLLLRRVFVITNALILISLACTLPALNRTTETLEAPPTVETPAVPTITPQPLPPAVIETAPLEGERLALDGQLRLTFNQPMARDSVQGALHTEPAFESQITWEDDRTLVLSPTTKFAPQTKLKIQLDTGAKAQNGLPLSQPLTLEFETADVLRITQQIPAPGSVDISAEAEIVAAFNQPVAPLGENAEGNPSAFMVTDSEGAPASGVGEWLNTSTYIFKPQPPLAGGKTYRIAVNPQLTGLSGAPIQAGSDWSFAVALPAVIEVAPKDGDQRVRLDSKVVLTFNQPMDRTSVENQFALLDAGGRKVAGSASWNEEGTQFTFTPANLLERGKDYQVLLSGQSLSAGGTPIEAGVNTTWHTAPRFQIASSQPASGGQKGQYEGIVLYFSSPIGEKQPERFLRITPEIKDLNTWWDEGEWALRINGYFEPSTDYTLEVLPDLTDAWGAQLGAPYRLPFRTAPLPPNIVITAYSDAIFLTTKESYLTAQAVNLPKVTLESGSLSLSDWFMMLAPNGYEYRKNFLADDHRIWSQPLEQASNRSQPVQLSLQPDGTARGPGLYYLDVDLPGQSQNRNRYLLVVSDVNLTFKLSQEEAFVWAVDLASQTPLANTPIVIYGAEGETLASGTTDAQGIFRSPIPSRGQGYENVFAVSGTLGSADFGLAMARWNAGVGAWDFSLRSELWPNPLKVYLYTDRPIYRPGQTVYFKGIVRSVKDGRYSKMDLEGGELPLTIRDGYGRETTHLRLATSAFGSVAGEYSLPADAEPGNYCIQPDQAEEYGTCFEVAAYRKPEIELGVTFDQNAVLAGDKAKATIEARYFFDAPVSNLEVKWSLYAGEGWVEIDDYTTSEIDLNDWVFVPDKLWGGLGRFVSEGSAKTDSQGKASLTLPTEPSTHPETYFLEVTATDESGFPVSKRAELMVYPSRFLLGVKIDQWYGRVNDPIGVEVVTVDWDHQAVRQAGLRAEFSTVTWDYDLSKEDEFGLPQIVMQTELVASADFSTAENGLARLEFTPPAVGTYLLSIRGEGVTVSKLVWVGGEGSARWPSIPNNRLDLLADKAEYKAGDSAQILLVNTFSPSALALVTVERANVRRYDVLRLSEGGTTYTLPLTEEDAPNVYLSVMLIGQNREGAVEFRQGYLNLPIKPEQQTLQVSLTSQPQRAGPGDDVTFQLQVKDNQQRPVRGEFSLAVVDKAIFELAEPNAPSILDAFYGIQPLGVQTGSNLAISAARMLTIPGGMGGGGGEEAVSVSRQKFPDTALWMAKVITDDQGMATVQMTLPDNLTTWVILARGITEDSRVGEAQIELVSTKELIVRPAVSRFWVAGDHVLLAAVVQNNTAQALTAQVSLAADGFTLDADQQKEQTFSIPANGRVRVEWWGKVDAVQSADVVISASAGELKDSVRLAGGKFPVQQYLAPQTYSTSGIMDAGGVQTEAVSLPPSSVLQGGSLRVEMTPSLAGVVLDGVKSVKDVELHSTEQALSRLMADHAALRLLKESGVSRPEMEAELNQSIERETQYLLAQQRTDGSWSWWEDGSADALITAYVVFGLHSVSVPQGRLEKAKEYLTSGLVSPGSVSDAARLSRLAFIHFVLAHTGNPDAAALQALYERREQLSPWAQALLALALELQQPGGTQAQSMYAEVEGRAIRTASGAHWEEQTPTWRMSSYQLTVTAMTLYALASADAATPLVADAARYLVSQRKQDGSWGSSFSTAWALMALEKVMSGNKEAASAFAFSASLNGAPLVSGSAAEDPFTLQVGEVNLERLYRDLPNALTFQRDGGTGRLYYRSILTAYQPVETAKPVQKGVYISRSYQALGESCQVEACPLVSSAPAGTRLLARLTVTLENDAYYLVVRDAIPAGSELLDRSLNTSQMGLVEEEISPQPPSYQFSRKDGLGWMYFGQPVLFDDHILWAADYLPAGTYELTYILTLLQPGEYRVLPARAWEYYFPDVLGTSAGMIFTITK